MEPIFKLTKTILQKKSSRFNYTCIDCCEQLIALGTDIGSLHLYSTKTLSTFTQIYLPNLPHSNQSEKKKQSIITSCAFSLIQHQKNFILLLIGTESGHIHLYNVDIANCRLLKVQTIKMDKGNMIQSLLWCKLERMMNNYNNSLHNVRGSKMDETMTSKNNEHIQSAPIESLKIIVATKCGKIYLLHLISNYINTNRLDSPVKIVNVQMIYQFAEDEIIQTAFKTHFVLVSSLTKCIILDFSKIYNLSSLAEREKIIKNDKNHFHSLPFVNGQNLESMKYFINIYQIGTKPRSGHYGACFDCQSIDGCDQILSARKSGRLWVGETQSGSVRNTLRFKLPKVPNSFIPTTSSLKGDGDIIWNKELEKMPKNEENDDKTKASFEIEEYEFSNVSDTFCHNLGVLIPFGNWTLSYSHPEDEHHGDVNADLSHFDFGKMDKKNKRIGYHDKLNHFGLKILDCNIPKLLQWYPNLGEVVDISVLESQCCFYIIYKPLKHSITNQSVILGKVELCSPNQSVEALINDDKITIAIDYICAYKVRDIKILETIKKLLMNIDNLHVSTIDKFEVHFEETKAFYDDHMDQNEELQSIEDENENDDEKEEDDAEKDVFKKYRKASMDYAASKKSQQLTDRTKDNKEEIDVNKLKWEPAKFDVTTAAHLGSTIGSPQVIVKENMNEFIISDKNKAQTPKDSDLFSTKKFLSIGKKVMTKTMNITQDLISGNSPKPSPPAPLPAIDLNENNEDENEEDDVDLQSDEDEARDSFAASMSLDSVQSIDYKQKQRIARARRKSSANQQIFSEAAEPEEPLKIISEKTPKKKKRKKKKKLKKSKSKKSKFAAIDPAPKTSSKQKAESVNSDKSSDNISVTAKSGSGSILAMDASIKPHEVIYDDDGMIVTENNNNDENELNVSAEEDGTISVSRIHELLKKTEKVDFTLRRRMRMELEDLYENEDENDVYDMESNENPNRKRAMVGLSNINYKTCPNLMSKMSFLLGEYEKMSSQSEGALKHVLFYKWSNKIGEKLSTALTRMLCVFISVKIDIGKESEGGVIEILKKFLLILDFKWVLKLCNTHRLHSTLRQLAALQYEQNEDSFNRIEIEKAYLTQNYQALIKLIDKCGSPLLVMQYLPLLCEKGFSHLCYSICVGHFPHCAPWFVRKCMYRYALDTQAKSDNNMDANEWNNIFTSYLKYLKLLFNVHPRTRCSGLLVLDLITLTLSLNCPSNDKLFKMEKEERKNESKEENDDDDDDVLDVEYKVPTQFSSSKIPLIHSEIAYSDALSKLIISIMSDRSYYIEWSYLEIVFKQYGFWKGLYRVYHHFQNIESLILLCVHLDYAQPIFTVLNEHCSAEYWKNLLCALSFVNKNQNTPKNGLNYEVVLRNMMRNIGSQETLKCLNDANIQKILRNNVDNIIYKEIVHQKQHEKKREKLMKDVQRSLADYISSNYNSNERSTASAFPASKNAEFERLSDVLSKIKPNSDEWAVMCSANARPPTQRVTAFLEKNLTDLFAHVI